MILVKFIGGPSDGHEHESPARAPSELPRVVTHLGPSRGLYVKSLLTELGGSVVRYHYEAEPDGRTTIEEADDGEA